ncbi:hypothetical protein ACWCQZ_35630 [Streptomyces sp. NPDC002285]
MAIKKQLAAAESAVVLDLGALGHQHGVRQGPVAMTPAAETSGNTPWT